MIQHKWLIALLSGMMTAAGLLPSILQAATLSISSASAEIDGDKHIAIHRGDVELTEGDKKLKADNVVLHRHKDGKIHKLVATGAPATYHGTAPQLKSTIQGQASTITYYPTEEKLVLEGNAKLSQGEDTFEGPELTYEIAKKRIASMPAANGRTTIILQTR